MWGDITLFHITTFKNIDVHYNAWTSSIQGNRLTSNI